MGQIIVITAARGGQGKTTLVANVSAALAMLGKEIIAVDMDVNVQYLDLMMGLENSIAFDLHDVLEERCQLSQALIRHKAEGFRSLRLLAASQTGLKNTTNPDAVRRLCADLRDLCDFAVLDTAGFIRNPAETVLASADTIIVVVEPLAWGVREALDLLQGFGLSRPRHNQDVHVVINRLQPERLACGDMLTPAEVVQALPFNLLGVVPEDDLVVECRGELAIRRPARSPAFQEFQDIAHRLLGEQRAMVLE